MNVADRTRCTLTDEPALNANPGFPYHYCQKSGFFEVTPLLVPQTSLNVYFMWPGECGTTQNGDHNGNSGDWRTVLAWCDNPAIIIMPRRVKYFPDGFGEVGTSIDLDRLRGTFEEGYYEPGKYYRLEIVADGSGLTEKIFGEGEHEPRNLPRVHHRHDDPQLFAAGHTFNFGMPPAHVRDALYADDPVPGLRYSIDNLKINRVELVEV